MVPLHSGADSLKDNRKGFSVNNFLNQQLVLGIDIGREFLRDSALKFTTNNTTLPLYMLSWVI